MDKTFDELFDEFMNPKPKPDMKVSDRIQRIIDMMMMPELSNFISKMGDKMKEELGEPDETSSYTQNGVTYVKDIWYTEKGDIISTYILDSFDTPEVIVDLTQELSIEEQLEKAVQEEDYEKAAKLRDLINPPKKKRGRPKKVEK